MLVIFWRSLDVLTFESSASGNWPLAIERFVISRAYSRHSLEFYAQKLENVTVAKVKGMRWSAQLLFTYIIRTGGC